MKKRITLFLALMLSIVAVFSTLMVGAVAEEPNEGWNVTVAEHTIIKGSDVTISYTLKYGEDEVTAILSKADDGVEYLAKPYVQIFEGETAVADGTLNVKASAFDVGTKTLTLKIFDKKEGGILLAETTFKLNVQKKDNTTTYVMIGLIVLIVAYMIWSSISNKKKQKKAQEQATQIKIGDKVKTIGGVCGFVKEVNNSENTFILEVGEKSFVKFDMGAIYQTAPANGNFDDPKNADAKKETKKEDKKEEK